MIACLSSTTIVLAALAAQTACSSSNEKPASSANNANTKQHNEAVDRLDSATRLVTDFREKVPYEIAREVKCVVAIPNMTQGGLIVGARGGRGFAGCRKGEGSDWGSPAPVSISGGTFGAQIGMQTVDLMLLGMTDKARSALEAGKFQLGVDASASAGTVGTGTGRDFKLGSDVLTYARSQGLFAGATFSGGSISRDDDATQALYGGMPSLMTMLEGGVPMPGASAGRFMTALRNSFGPGSQPAASLSPEGRAGL
jgi:lipid-binding SYLF domain-containing protein